MKCISLWQPWASLIAIGAKHCETRSWETLYRGPIAIHAAKTWNRALAMRATTDPHCQALKKGGVQISHWKSGDALPKGAILATAVLAGCVRIDATNAPMPRYSCRNIACSIHVAPGRPTPIHRGGSDYQCPICFSWMRPEPSEYAFGDYTPGRFRWNLSDIVRLAKPVPFKGRQGLFDVPDGLLL